MCIERNQNNEYFDVRPMNNRNLFCKLNETIVRDDEKVLYFARLTHLNQSQRKPYLHILVWYVQLYVYIIISTPLYVFDIVTDPDTATILLGGHAL